MNGILAGKRRLERLFDETVVPMAGTPGFDTGVKPYAAELDKVVANLARYSLATQVEAAPTPCRRDPTPTRHGWWPSAAA